MRIHILGASGSGTTSIGRKLSENNIIPFFDIDEIFWKKSDIPFTVRRDINERKEKLSSIIANNNDWIISGAAVGWGDQLLHFSDCIILLRCLTKTRIERLKKREIEQFGDRILPGNDMYENYMQFMEWASFYDTGGMNVRSLLLHKSWLSKAQCPVIQVVNDDFDKTILLIENKLKKFI